MFDYWQTNTFPRHRFHVLYSWIVIDVVIKPLLLITEMYFLKY